MSAFHPNKGIETLKIQYVDMRYYMLLYVGFVVPIFGFGTTLGTTKIQTQMHDDA